MPAVGTPWTPLHLSDLAGVMRELKRLSAQMASLPDIVADIKAIKTDLSDLKSMKSELAEVKNSVDFVHQAVESLSSRISEVDRELQGLRRTKDDLITLQQRIEKIESAIHENEQRSRLNNIEIKGVPFSPSENLFSIVSKIGDLVKCSISKEQINYVARVPMRNDKTKKTIIVSVHNRYLKDDFVSAAKKCTITSSNLNLQGSDRIFVNDHLTLENKLLLNKVKSLAKERGFAFTWVKGCKIFIRKNPTSPAVTIRSESDLKKFLI